jgi:hypothetical protein
VHEVAAQVGGGGGGPSGAQTIALPSGGVVHVPSIVSPFSHVTVHASPSALLAHASSAACGGAGGGGG